jgi:hypothetical protein
MECTLFKFVDDIKREIFQHLDQHSYLQLRQTCKYLYNFYNETHADYWKDLFHAEYYIDFLQIGYVFDFEEELQRILGVTSDKLPLEPTFITRVSVGNYWRNNKKSVHSDTNKGSDEDTCDELRQEKKLKIEQKDIRPDEKNFLNKTRRFINQYNEKFGSDRSKKVNEQSLVTAVDNELKSACSTHARYKGLLMSGSKLPNNLKHAMEPLRMRAIESLEKAKDMVRLMNYQERMQLLQLQGRNKYATSVDDLVRTT